MATASHRHEHSVFDEQIEELEPETAPIVLTARDLEVFLAEWANPSKPHPRLEEAARRYQSRRQPDAG